MVVFTSESNLLVMNITVSKNNFTRLIVESYEVEYLKATLVLNNARN
jgi:hypothetical protein